MKLTVRQMAVAGLLGAVSFVMGYVFPVLGFIPVPTAAGSATLLHIPAILAGVAEGPVVGAFVGLIFGLLSFLHATNALFTDPLVAVLPRILIGITAYYSFAALRRRSLSLGLGAAAVVGTLTNTVGVLGMAVVRGYLPAKVALVTGAIHGAPEIVVAAVIVVVAGAALARVGFIRRPAAADGVRPVTALQGPVRRTASH